MRLIFRPKSEIQTFFPPKIRWSPKKKKRSSPKLRLIFRPISEIQKFEGGLFSYGGAIFNFSQKIGLKSTKNVRFCILHKPMGGLEPPAPPGYATAFISFFYVKFWLCSTNTTMHPSWIWICWNCWKRQKLKLETQEQLRWWKLPTLNSKTILGLVLE